VSQSRWTKLLEFGQSLVEFPSGDESITGRAVDQSRTTPPDTVNFTRMQGILPSESLYGLLIIGRLLSADWLHVSTGPFTPDIKPTSPTIRRSPNLRPSVSVVIVSFPAVTGWMETS